MALEDVEAEVEEAVQRRRASPKAVVQWLVRHAAGLPLREASASEVEGLKRSHNAIWRRIQMFALKLFEADRARLGRPRIIILDETSMNPSGEMAFLHAAINPDSRRILLLRLYPSRSTITVYAFMEQFIKRYGRPKLVCTEGGPRHHQALKWLRLRHKAISGGFRTEDSETTWNAVPNPKTAHRKIPQILTMQVRARS
ncbi:MAG: hypothetical protein ACP5QI_04790 [Candidatus Bathyarchaeia archaeon]